MAWVADDLAGWLVERLADAGRRRLADLVLGDDFERALRQAATAAVHATADELSPSDEDRAERLAMVISEVFAAPAPGTQGGRATVLDTLRAGVAAQVAVLEDRELTGTGQSSADVAGIQTGALAPLLTRHLLAGIVSWGARGGPLFPLAVQLNADVARLQGQQTHDLVRQLGTELLEAITRIGPPPDPAADSDDAAFAAERERYLARLQERYRRVDLEVLTPLAEQGEQPQMLLGSVFVPQLVRADPPPLELPRELWHRLTEAGEAGETDLPEGLDRQALERAHRQYQGRPAERVLDAVSGPGAGRVVLLGDPGAGKSTLARYLMLAMAAQGSPGSNMDIPVGAALTGALPLLVELRTFASPQWRERTFLDLIDRLHQTENLGMSRPVLERYLRQGGPALIAFDGLDEVFDPAIRELVTRQIEAFAGRYPQVRVIVTSRVVGYRRAILDAAGFTHWMLQDLDTAQIRSFTSAWYAASCPDDPAEGARLRDRLLRAVRDSAAVAELASNPMLLTILAIIGRRQELPRERRLVYEHAVMVLIEHWDATGKHLRDPGAADGMPYLSSEDKLELLRLVARRMQDGPAGLAGNHLPGSDLCAEFENYLRQRYELPASQAAPAARAMLGQLRERNFILALFGAGVYGFVHRAFLEYLAAADICGRFAAHDISADDLFRVFADHWADPAWHEVLVLIAGMIPSRFAGNVVTRLLQADPAWQMQTQMRPAQLPSHLVLAIRCLGEIRKPGEVAALGRTVSAELVLFLNTWGANQFIMTFPDLLGTFASATLPVLGRLGPHWAGRPLFENWCLSHGQFIAHHYGEVSVSYTAARMYLALLGQDPQAAHVMIRRHAERGAGADLRQAAVGALASGWPGDPGTLTLLHDRATADPHAIVRQAAVRALASGWPGDPDALTLLHDRATADPHAIVRQAAVRALASGWPGDPDALTLLHDRATADPHAIVRQAAVRALASGWPGDPGTPLTLLQDLATTDPDAGVRQAAVGALAGWPGDPGALTLLHDLATTDPDAGVRQAAVGALAGWPGDPGALTLLHDLATTDPDAGVRQAAVGALAGWPGDPGALTLLHDLATTDPDAGVRQAAVGALAGWPGDPGALTLLHDLATTDPHKYVRQAAVGTLAGWPGDPDSLTLLHDRATTDRDEYVRQAAVQALASRWHDEPGTLTRLRDRAATDRHEYVRQAAVGTLAGWPGDPDSLTLLHDLATTDQYWGVRQTAVGTLAGWPGDRGTLTLLRDRATTDRHEYVRQAAVQALASRWHDDPGTLTLLRDRATTDRHEYVRQAAVQALASRWHDDPGTLTLLRDRATTDRHEYVRQAAVQALASRWHDDPGTLTLLHNRATTDADAEVRQDAVQALAGGWPDDPGTLRLLHDRATTDPSTDVRRAALGALAGGWHDDPGTLTLLHNRATTDQHWRVRQDAVQALAGGWPDDPGTLTLLHDRATTDQHEYVRDAAVQALAGGWPDEPGTLTLLQDRATTDQHEYVRRAAVQALAGGWPDEPGTLTLLHDRATTDQHEYVRRAAAQALDARRGWRS